MIIYAAITGCYWTLRLSLLFLFLCALSEVVGLQHSTQ